MKATTLNLFDAPFLATAQSVTPSSFGAPVRWYNANTLREDYGFANDAIIGPQYVWRDLSPSRVDARSSTTREPIFKSDELSEINGRPVVRFQGAKHFLFESPVLVFRNFTVLAVINTANDSIFVTRNGVNVQLRVTRLGIHNASWFSGISGTEELSNVFTSNINDPRMVGFRRRATTAQDWTFTFFDNANPVAAAPGGGTGELVGFNQIGSIDYGPTDIDIAEIVFYDTELSTTQIQALYNGYFKPEFALP